MRQAMHRAIRSVLRVISINLIGVVINVRWRGAGANLTSRGTADCWAFRAEVFSTFFLRFLLKEKEKMKKYKNTEN
jgi:hypothetical protein